MAEYEIRSGIPGPEQGQTPKKETEPPVIEMRDVRIQASEGRSASDKGKTLYLLSPEGDDKKALYVERVEDSSGKALNHDEIVELNNQRPRPSFKIRPLPSDRADAPHKGENSRTANYIARLVGPVESESEIDFQ